ncbi:Protein of unknown function (DUF2637) [Brevibacterium sp. 239c]|uniref:DUF2637 domain-containing protein n=1 Tax=Brevibacterium sp. 239c TaxID=1965356 RepID=UPI000C35744A|nr:DUF2637 domain-containing protein [Brevibacterium sp. 239c]SMY04331.1 Protein of unknown function (DUF2637) [Brevibacterium sp. 239c]
MTTDNTALAHTNSNEERATSPVKDEAAQPENHARAFSRILRHDQGTPSESTTAVNTGPKSRINPDDHRFVRLITVGVAFAGLVAFAISFVALMEVASWLGLPEWMHWAVPAFIDTAILVYAGSILIHKTRGEKTWQSWVLLAAFTGLSVIANVAHALTYGDATEGSWQGLIGAVIAGMVPFAVFAATEQLSRVAVEDPISRRREKQAEAEWLAEQAERERKQLEVEAEREAARQEAELAREQHATNLEVVRAQRDALATKAAQAAEDGEQFALPRTPWLASVPDPETSEKTPPAPGGGKPKTAPADMDALVDFISGRTAQGEDTSGADLAAQFGFSDKTGRRRLAALRDSHPQIFTGGQ